MLGQYWRDSSGLLRWAAKAPPNPSAIGAQWLELLTATGNDADYPRRPNRPSYWRCGRTLEEGLAACA
jgi:hypothetical protein